MTGSDTIIPPIPLSEKLSLVTHHHLLTRVPVKLDLDHWNYGSWEFFFEQPCSTYDVEKYIRSPSTKSSTTSLAPLTPEELKVDKIVLSWILFTLSDSLQARSRTNALKAELRSIKFGDQSMESYFQKINSIVNILISLDARVNDEDVVHHALEGLPDTYNQVCGYMHWKDTFPDLKTVRSLLITEETRLKSRALALPVESSSPMSFRYLHDVNACVGSSNSGNNKGRGTNENSTNELLTKLLQQLGNLGLNATVSNSATNNTPAVAFLANPASTPSPPVGPTPLYPPGFAPHAHAPTYFYPVGPPSAPAHSMPFKLAQQFTSSPILGQTQLAQSTTQATLLPQAFTARTLHDPSTGAWNMDTVNLPPTFWVEALNMVTHLLNILPSTAIANEVLFGTHPDYSFLRTFGCLCPDLNTNKILISRHVTFDETVFPYGSAKPVSLFCHKYLADGTLSRYKARLVANGSTQLKGIDVDETFSLVVKPMTIRTVLSLVASRHWPVHQQDVKNAYVYGDLSETIYMHQPPGFQDSAHPDYVCLLQRSLYGLKQASRAWFQRFASYITRVGFQHSRYDTSLFIYRQGMNTAYLLLYVDDIALTASFSDLLQRIIHSLHQEFPMTDLAGMVNCNANRTHVDTKSKLGDTSDVVSDPTLYRSLAGSLQYLTFTRPDISYAVHQVCLHMHDPREPHLSALKRILRYVCGTLDYGLQLFSSSTTDLVAYLDVD
ncbi:ribonuclease H-like domain-containing protein [Tanacetum coccineum]|uniref:Ribonuclease H-like domain-containing protein n=1 Tax=Tanacetum coccineum TaxID=301880 RepID=A0ABQ5DR91_9ASTR